jgi:hypothetical protein
MGLPVRRRRTDTLTAHDERVVIDLQPTPPVAVSVMISTDFGTMSGRMGVKPRRPFDVEPPAVRQWKRKRQSLARESCPYASPAALTGKRSYEQFSTTGSAPVRAGGWSPRTHSSPHLSSADNDN